MKRLGPAIAVLVLLLGAASAAGAQTAIRGGTVHPVASEPVEEGVVVFGRDGEINAVGGPSTEVPENVDVIDASGRVVTPGFVDANTHLGLVEVWAVSRTRDDDRGGGDAIRAAFRAADGFDPSSAAIPVARTGGVTSVVSVPNGGIVSGQSAWVDLGGAETGFGTVVEPSAAVHMQYHGLSGEGSGVASIRSRAGLMEKLRELYDDVAYYGDNREAFNTNDTRDFAASRLDLEALVETLDRAKPVAFETHRASDIANILDFAQETGLDPVIFGGAEAWKISERLASRDVPVVVQPTQNLPESFDELGARMDGAALLSEAGVPVVISTFDTHNVRKLRQMAGNAIRAGLSREAALRAVTLHPARAFGLDDQYGTLEAGKVGNAVVWSGDPFELSSRVETVVVQGTVVSLENRQQKLFERYRELDRRGSPAEKDPGEADGED
jgi:imidazolonepropionase-like amidohydrolase